MNRRTFMIALAGSACAGRASPGREQGDRGSDTHDPIPTDTPQRPSPLAVHGDVLVERAGSELRWWDTRTMTRVDTVAISELAAFTILADGSVVAFVERSDGCSLQRIAPDRESRMYIIKACAPLSRLPPIVLGAGSPDTLYIVGDEVELFRFAGFHLERIGAFELPRARDPARAQMFSLDDGRIVTRGDGIAIVGPNGTSARSLGERRVEHLARATGDRFWYSSTGAWGASGLVLAPVERPREDVVALDVGPARIVAMTSRQDTVAVLLVTREGAWSVALFDEGGHERWRTAVPPDSARTFVATDVAIALTDHRLVVRAPDAFHSWDAANGKP